MHESTSVALNFSIPEPETWLRADAVYSMLTLAGATVLELATPIPGRLLNTPLLLFVTSRLHDALCGEHLLTAKLWEQGELRSCCAALRHGLQTYTWSKSWYESRKAFLGIPIRDSLIRSLSQ